jgi:GGDEF domain-containing protein
MPNTDMAQARLALARLCEGGFGTRPDGRAVTASIGVAERIGDRAPDWKTLVETADRRMYHAKRCGRDRVAFEDEAFAAA